MHNNQNCICGSEIKLEREMLTETYNEKWVVNYLYVENYVCI